MNQTRTLALDRATGPRAQVRVGTVTAATPNSLTVNVAGTSITASFLRGADIVEGDLVSLLEQGGSWLALGALAGVGANEIINPSFEDDLLGWTVYQSVGTSAATVFGPTSLAVDGNFYLQVSTEIATATSIVYSSPIQVSAGEQFSVSAYVWGTYQPAAAEDADADLMALWFANDTNLYPTTSSADTVISSLTNVPSRAPISSLSGTVTAPVTGFMRIGLRSVLSSTGSLGYDLIIARELA
jgi:hypothetical protein